MSALWHYGETFFVKLYRQVDGEPNQWVGWLGDSGVESSYAQPVAGDPAGTPPAGAARVQWVFDAQRGDATDQASYEQEIAARPRYLTSQGRVLGGAEGMGFDLYWWSVDVDQGYPLTVGEFDDASYVTISRVSTTDPAGSVINTYEDDYLGYYKYGNEFTVLFDFASAASYDPAAHPTWVGDRNAVIGDRPLAQLVIPGSHDAGTYQISRAGGEMTSRAQQVDIMGQLLGGSRYLDLRTDMYQDVWYIRHGSDWTDVRFDHVVDQLASFLDSHPTEFVLVALLVADVKGVPGMTGDYKNAWQLLYTRLHARHLNATDETGATTDITKVTPNTLRTGGKSLLTFSWGAAESWYFDVDAITGEFLRYAEPTDPPTPGAERIFISPWPSKPEGEAPAGLVADLEGVYLDWGAQVPQASDILAAYEDYTPTGGLWNLQTNLPWKIANFDISLYQNHSRVTPGLVSYLSTGQIARGKANIVNMDYLGDTVITSGPGSDLVSAVIALNDR